MILPPTLVTDRLVLEPLARKHSAGMFLLWSRDEVCRYSGVARDWDGNPIRLPVSSAADSNKIIHFFGRLSEQGNGFRWAMAERDSGEFVGTIGFNRLTPNAELAFHLRPEFWSRGLMREAAEAALAWSKQFGVSTVEAFVEPGNRTSIALVRRLGLAPTGVVQDGAEQYLRHL